MHSKVMAWVAVDRAIKSAEQNSVSTGDMARWKAIRDEIHEEVCRKAFDRGTGQFRAVLWLEAA